MKLYNFRPLGSVPAISRIKPGLDATRTFAIVSVKTKIGPFWNRREVVEDRIVSKNSEDPFWHFVDTGGYTPGEQIADLARAHASQHALLTSAVAGQVKAHNA